MPEYKAQAMSCMPTPAGNDMRGMALAMAYTPWQHWNRTYELKKALCVGTIFPELDKPFLGKRGGCR